MRPKWDWEKIRAEYEVGETQNALSRKYGVSRKAIQKHIEKEGWTQDIEPSISRRVAEKVAGVVAPCDPEKKAEAIDAEALRRADVVKRHREEWNACRERLYAGLKEHKAAGTKEEKQNAFEDLKAAKISSEALSIIQDKERKAWNIDNNNSQDQSKQKMVRVVFEDGGNGLFD